MVVYESEINFGSHINNFSLKWSWVKSTWQASAFCILLYWMFLFHHDCFNARGSTSHLSIGDFCMCHKRSEKMLRPFNRFELRFFFEIHRSSKNWCLKKGFMNALTILCSSAVVWITAKLANCIFLTSYPRENFLAPLLMSVIRTQAQCGD